MSGSFNDLDVPPTLVAFALAPGKASLALSPEFKQAGSTVSLVAVPRDAHNLPDFAALKQLAEQLHQLNAAGHILSLHHIGHPGLAAALTRMALGNRIGFTTRKTGVPPVREDGRPACQSTYFTERYFTFLIEHLPAAADSIRHAIPTLSELGHTTTDPILTLDGQTYQLTDLQTAWMSTLEPVYPTKIVDSGSKIGNSRSEIGDRGSEIGDSGLKSAEHTSSPISYPLSPIPYPRPPVVNVVIPAFPGTNSEYDSAKAFRLAGADAEIVVFRNLTTRHIEESLTALAERIRRAQILMFPGGFSAGDEPDGSAKFIATIIRSPRVADAIMDLLRNRDGLILGVCNGFQALIKTGLVPYGEIVEKIGDRRSEIGDGRNRDTMTSSIHDPASRPTLVHNDIGRHVSCYVHTRVVSTLSPWLANSKVGDIHTLPISHGEGKFFASDAIIAELAAAGQIATQYCDADGIPSMDIALNPNGSLAAIEGITSPCGRVFAKMAHSERAGHLVAKNIPGQKHQPIFEAGVAYFA